jgi:outer membrane receptor for ferrienterochelin and colicin
MRPSRKSVLLALAFSAPLTAAAQVTTARVEGRVLDESGAPIAGATVTATHTATGLRRVVTSDEAGSYRILSLPVGPYEVSVAQTGFATETRSGVTLRVGQEASLDFRLKVATLEETVTVQADVPIVETTKSALGAIITTQQIDELAVADRNFENLAYLVPGVLNTSGDAESSETGIGSAGALGTGNTFLVDGVSNDADALSESRGTFSLDAIAEYQVLTSQYPAEFGQASGAIINVLTRSGTNELRGRVFGYYRADELSANDPFVQADPDTGEKQQAPFSQKIFGGYLGGPLKKDKTFFFLSYDHTFRDDTAVVSVDPQTLQALGVNSETSVPHPTRRPLLLAKLDHRLNPDQTLTLRYRLDHRKEENFLVGSFAAGGVATQETGATVKRVNQDVALLHNWAISPGMLNEARFQYAWQANEVGVENNCPGCPFILRPGILTGKASSFPQDFTEKRFQFTNALTFNVNGGHSFKAGVDYSRLKLDGYVEQNFDGVFIFQTAAPFDAGDPATYPFIYQVSEGDPNFDIDNDILALYVQDQWRVTPNFTLNLGLRWDYENSEATKDNKGNVGPRLHFAWDPWKDGRTSLRGGYGRYYDQVFLNVILFSKLLDGSLQTTTLLFPGYPDPFVGGAGIPLPNPPPVIYRFQDGLKTPYSDTGSLGFQREIAPDVAVSVDGVYARGRNQLALIDVNYAGPGLPPVDPDFTQINEIQGEGRSTYKALQLGLVKRFSRRHSFGLAYTLSDTKRDADGHQFRPQDPRDLAAEYGPSDIDARHTFAGNVNWDAVWGIKLGLSGRYLSALPYNVTTGMDDNGDLNVNDRPAGVSRNSERGESAWTIDLRLAKAIALGKKASLELIAEAFNLLNHPSRGFFDGNKLSDSFGQPTAVASSFPPRQIQLGARLEF